MSLEYFIGQLQARPHSAGVTNPYLLSHRSENLTAYLEAILSRGGRRVLLVGEALGYRGGLLTGIPFSSARLLKQAPHLFLRQLRPQLVLEDDVAEATASIVWQCLEGRRLVPLSWNAFPFHPHKPGEPASNRAPTAAELREGSEYLRLLAELYQPDLVLGVGRKGYQAASRALPEVEVRETRHPSYGGKAEFALGLNRAYRARLT